MPDTPFVRHGMLRVSGTCLLDASGAPVSLRGVSTHDVARYPEYIQKESFRTFRDDWGANVVRLAMYTAEYAGYLTGADKNATEAILDRGVSACRELGLYAILDWHILSDCDPMDHVEEAMDFFDRMSRKYASDGHVIYEICNEPNGPRSDWAEISRYAKKVIPVIRQNVPDALILCGTPTWSQDVDQAALAPLSYDNLMYVLHFYAATHKDSLRDKLEKAVDSGLPVFISEFSICDASGNGGLDYDSAAAWRSLIQRHSLSYIGWNISNKDESSAFIKPECAKTSDWDESDITDSGLWLRACLREDAKEEEGQHA